MLRKEFIIIALIFLFPGLTWAAEQFVPGEILVKFRSTGITALSTSSLAKLNSQYGLISADKVFPKAPVGAKISTLSTGERRTLPDLSRIYKLVFPKDVDIPEVVAAYQSDPQVEYAEPNYILRAHTPNDPAYKVYPNNPNQWGLFKIGLTSTESGTSGWNITQGSASVPIAVIDTGVDWNHPDLSANIWLNTADPINGVDDDANGYVDDYRGWDFVSVAAGSVFAGEDPGPRDNDPMDFEGHGTHVSGIASAANNNGVGGAGTGWNCTIMAVRAGYKNAAGDGVFNTDDIAAAISYAADRGAKVINMSFGSLVSVVTIQNAVVYAFGKDCVLVGSAGNDNNGIQNFPSAYDQVICVAGTDVNDSKASYSNFGTHVDVSAPGGDGWPVTPGMIYSTYFNDTYAWAQGTSQAAPFVAGLAGLIRSKFPSLTNDNVRSLIVNKADNIDAQNPGYINLLGSGRINAFASLYETTPPTVRLITPNGGENLYITQNYNITWTATDDSAVAGNGISILYTTGETYIPIATNITNSGTYCWTVPSLITTEAKVKVVAVDILGNTASDESDGFFSIRPETSLPLVLITSPVNNQRISGTLEVTGTASDENLSYYLLEYGKDGGYYRIVSSETAVISGRLGTWETAGLLPGNYILRLTAHDPFGHSTQASVEVVLYLSGDTRLVEPPRSGPSPFNPLYTQPLLISYKLNDDADIQVHIYNMYGELVWRGVYPAGTAGGRAGTNNVVWDGRDAFGNLADSGVYLYQIIFRGKIISKGKFACLKN